MYRFASRALRKQLSRGLPASARGLPRSGLGLARGAASGDKLSSVMYNWRVAAVQNALALRGKAEGPLTIEDLTSLGHLDQYHYLGTEACDEAISLLGIGTGAKVVDVGSGIGGPARYIAAKSGCDITGVELQGDLVEAAKELTSRASLSDKVSFITGAFQEVCGAKDGALAGQFDHLLSLLTFCHFPDRDGALHDCFACLKPGGTFLIEDMALVGEAFTAAEEKELRDVVSTHNVTSAADYIAALERAGFVDVVAVDLSESWRAWTKARHETFKNAKDANLKLHGEEVFAQRVSFYESVDRLFAGGNLGGIRVTGRRRGVAEEKMYAGRRHAATATAKKAVLNEMGSTVDAGAGVAQQVPQSHSVQPLFATGPADAIRYHDSLQYHFFFPGYFIAGRVFHTHSLQQHSAWMYNTATGETTELFDPCYSPMVQRQGESTLDLESEELSIVDNSKKGLLVAKKHGISVSFEQRNISSWEVAESKDIVIHRPDLLCKVEMNGKVLEGTGYSKRYHGLYPRFWGYCFIHGVVENEDGSTSPFWTADAHFGDRKYDYFKMLLPSGGLLASKSSETWQQRSKSYAIVDGDRYEVSLQPLASWDLLIGGQGHAMESHMQNRYCNVELTSGGYVRRGVAYNERCFGTLG